MNDTVQSGKYEILAPLGRGGMADVSLALARGPAGVSRLVVLKELRQELSQDAEHVSMFLSEARLGARLQHPALVPVIELGQDGSRLYMEMEFLEGQPLHRILSRVEHEGGLSLGVHLAVLCEVLAGLDYAHELTDWDGTALGVVHRDVSPHNVFVTYEGRVKLVDFGIAKGLDAPLDTKNGLVKGKAAYMAPEQAEGADVDRRADVYSAGVMLWETLAGRRLFQGLSDVAILKRLASADVPSPSTENPEVAPELERVCMRALAHLPADRYETAREFRTELCAAMKTLGLFVSTEDVAAPIATAFSAERAALRQTITRRLRERADDDHRCATSSYPPRFTDFPTPLGFGTSLADSDAPPRRAEREAPTVPPPARKRRRLVVAGRIAAGAAAMLVFSLVALRRPAPDPANRTPTNGSEASPASTPIDRGASLVPACGAGRRLDFDMIVNQPQGAPDAPGAHAGPTCSLACACAGK